MTIRAIQVLTVVLPLLAFSAEAQVRFAGSAVVRIDQMEYLIPIECDDSARPELGFSTELSRITREATGRTSPVHLRLRQWQDTDEVVVTLDRFAAWIPRPEMQGPVLFLNFAMSPSSVVRDGLPVTMTYDMWTSGDRPEGITVEIEADCQARDPAAPSSRRLP